MNQSTMTPPHDFEDLCQAVARDGLPTTWARASSKFKTTLVVGGGGSTDIFTLAKMCDEMLPLITAEQLSEHTIALLSSASGTRDGDFAVYDDRDGSPEPPPLRGADGRYAADHMYTADGMRETLLAAVVEMRRKHPKIGRIVTIVATCNKGRGGKFSQEQVDRLAAGLEGLLCEFSPMAPIYLDQGGDILDEVFDVDCSLGRDGLMMEALARCSLRMYTILPLVTAPGCDGCFDFSLEAPAAGTYLVGREGGDGRIFVRPISEAAARQLPAAPRPPDRVADLKLLEVADARALVRAVEAAFDTFAVGPSSTPEILVCMQNAVDILGPGYEDATLVWENARKCEGAHVRLCAGAATVCIAPIHRPRRGPEFSWLN